MAKYQGMTFTPYRTLTEDEKEMSLYHLNKYFDFTWDHELGMHDRYHFPHSVKCPYSHEEFYNAMAEDGWADIFYCEQMERYYIPTSCTMMQIKRHIAV